MSKRRKHLLPLLFLVVVLLGLGLWNSATGWWLAVALVLTLSAWIFQEVRRSWKVRQSDAAHRLDHTYEFLTFCFALMCALTLIALGIAHRAGVSSTPIAVVAAILFVGFCAVALPMRYRLESGKRRPRQGNG